ncbi:MAG: hypothetical protein GWO86_00615 [Planctomycetes bacterium]|nr:hypothetical protein [Planctomycetota bacterium]
MYEIAEQRKEKRLRYHWPVWFAEDFDMELSQGQMFDITSTGASFTCYADKCPNPGQSITTRFSIPRYGRQGVSFDVENYIRTGTISRVEEVNSYIRRVALQFAEALPFSPAEQDMPTLVRELSVVNED